jgi:RecA-family ATPase
MLTNKITPPPIQGVEVIKPNLSARAWQWKDPKTIPPRQWLYGAHYVRKFASATLAPGGVGKSSLGLVDAVGMACGRNLLGGESTNRPLAVWYWNLEDPAEEIDRRVSAILLHYHIDYEEVRDRFFVNSEEELVIAEKTRDMTLVRPEITGALISEISALSIDAVIIDPFVSCHRVPENDNGGMDVVAKAWARIARDATAPSSWSTTSGSRPTANPSSALTTDAGLSRSSA